MKSKEITISPINLEDTRLNKEFKSSHRILSSIEGKGKYLSIISQIDRIGKIDSHFEVGNILEDNNIIKSSYFDIALDTYKNLKV